MAKAGKPRHSGSTRTPPVINHEPLPKDDKKTTSTKSGAIEPEKQSANNSPSKQALLKPQVNKQTNDSTSSQTKDNTSSLDTSQTTDTVMKMTPEEKAPNKQLNNENTNNTKSNKGSSFLGGVAGGVIALVIAGGLQWGGLLPALNQNNTQNIDNSQIAALQEQIDTLKTSVEAQKALPRPDDATFQDITDKADRAINAAQSALNKSEENTQTLATLTTTITSFGAQNGDPNAITALSNQISQLEDKASLTDKLNTRLAENQGVLDQIRTRLNTMETSVAEVKNMNERLTNLEASEKNLKDSVLNLQQNAKTFEERILSANSTDYTRLIAANALKDAVDRGGSYINELQTFEKVAPKDISLNLLKTYANTGLPSSGELSKQFTKVADNIAATQYAAPDNAGFTDRLWASARQLVVTRPVGNTDGTTPGDIAARMEQAIEKGDYEQALAQWQTLPENAKAVSNEFIKLLTARRDANRLTNQLVTLATEQQTKPENE